MKCDELKDYDIMDIEAMDDERLEKSESGKIQVTRVYIKSEVDKMIAELKSEIERLEILCANYRHDCDNLAISNEQVKRAASTLLKKMNHNKRKRCLAMAKLCHWKMGVFIYKEEKSNFYHRWHKRLSMLAEKFKEAK